MDVNELNGELNIKLVNLKLKLQIKQKLDATMWKKLTK